MPAGQPAHDQPVDELTNITPTIARRLVAAGIRTRADLTRLGPVDAYHRLRASHPRQPIPRRYYLYALEGALTDQHWDNLGRVRKAELDRLATAPETAVSA